MKNIIRIAGVLAITLFAHSLNAIELKKLFHHKSAAAHTPGKSIEMASLVLYLDENPQVVKSVSKSGNMANYRFFLPSVQASSKQLQEMIDLINQSKDPGYSIAISMKSKPSHGMEIVLSCNEKQVGVVENSFDAITLDKGLVLRLFDKKLIKQIRKQNKPIIETAANDRPRVLIDCGHGGTDNGAIGCNGIKEKDVCLQVGLQIAQLLKDKKIDARLTRDTDATLTLADRTLHANSQHADLFISVHANSGSALASGIETFCLRPHLFKINSTDTVDSEQQLFITKLNEKYQKSFQLADAVHSQIIQSAAKGQAVVDRHVKYAASQVLIGTTMPAILVELGFVTNKNECALLSEKSYQQNLAQGIVAGIDKYLESNTLV